MIKPIVPVGSCHSHHYPITFTAGARGLETLPVAGNIGRAEYRLFPLLTCSQITLEHHVEFAKEAEAEAAGVSIGPGTVPRPHDS